MRRGALVGLSYAALLVAACGPSPAAAPTPTAVPTTVGVTTSPSPAATRAAAPATATPAPKPTDTPQPEGSETVWVGNTDGEGVYLRRTPVMADRVRAYVDGTPLTVLGEDVDGDDQHWKHVKTPDGLEGYVPSIYTVDAPP